MFGTQHNSEDTQSFLESVTHGGETHGGALPYFGTASGARRTSRSEPSFLAFGLLLCILIALTSRPAATQPEERRGDEHTVRAPFKVVDSDGKMIIDVEEAKGGEGHYLRLFDDKEEMMAHIGIGSDGGEVSVYGKSAQAYLWAGRDTAGLSANGNAQTDRSTVLVQGTPKGGRIALYDGTGKILFARPEASPQK